MHIRALREITYPQVVVALCLAAIVPFAMFRWGLGTLYPFIQEELDTSRAELGLITSGMFAGGVATALLIGWLADVIGARRMQTMALAWAAASVLLFSQIQSPLHGLLLGILIGVAFSSVGPSYIKAIMDWVTPQTRGLSIGIAEASIPASGIVAAVLVSILAVSFGWRSTVMVLAFMIAISSAVFFTFYRDKPRTNALGEKMSQPRGRVFLVAKNRRISLAALVCGTFTSTQSVVVTYFVLFLREHVGISPVVAGSFLAVAMAGGAVGRVGWGLLSDSWLGGRRVVALAIVGMLCGVSMVFMAWLPSDANLVLVAALAFMLGSTAMGWSGAWVVLVAELAGPALTGTAMGFSATICQVGALAITPLFGLVVDRNDSYDLAWWMMAGVAGTGTLLLALLAFLGPQEQHR